jgi:branched-subunit amino acid aminotransferase/4-amino-4-deoxychorismate lyase
MNPHVSFNFQILPAEKSFISAHSSAALYGRSVFTSLAIYNQKPFLWEKHWRRLGLAAARLGIDLSAFGEKAVKDALHRLILKNKLETARARLTFFDESASQIWNPGAKNKTSLFMTTAEFRQLKTEFLLNVSPFPINSRSPLAGIKSGNYLENLLALEDARHRGFDESVRINEKELIVSASTANIFWVKDGKVFTPALETGCLAGTTREVLLENFPILETRSKLEELFSADEIFLTSAGIGIRAASVGNAGGKSSSMIAKLNKLLDLQRLKA